VQHDIVERLWVSLISDFAKRTVEIAKALLNLQPYNHICGGDSAARCPKVRLKIR
jgi:3-phosphoglycerate kinase